MKKQIGVTLAVIFLASLCIGGILYGRGYFSGGIAQGLQNQEEHRDVADNLLQEDSTDIDADGEKREDLTEEMVATAVVSTEELATEEENGDTTLLFAGDFLFRTRFLNNYDSQGISAAMTEDLKQEFEDADIAMVNLEFPFSTRGIQAQDKSYTFRVDPKYATVLPQLGVDVVSLANNHVLDYDNDALNDTFATLDEQEVAYVGAGDSLERAKQPAVYELNGKKIGILASSRVIPKADWNVEYRTPGVFCTYDDTLLCQEIEAAGSVCDYVAVYLHWGVEYDEYPQDYQRQMARDYIEAGADFVIGTHTHCLQGIEFYQGKPIFYGLGNFGFGSEIEQTMAVRVTLSEKGQQCQIIPTGCKSGQAYRLTDEAEATLYQYMEGISQGVAIDENGVVSKI